MTFEFDDLNVTGAGLPGDEGMTNQKRSDFESMWKEGEAITQATEATLQIDRELGRAIDAASHFDWGRLVYFEGGREFVQGGRKARETALALGWIWSVATISGQRRRPGGRARAI